MSKVRSPSPGFDRLMEYASWKQAQWTRWFAWYPVMMNGERIWLKLVERRVPSHFDEQLQGWRPDSPMRMEYRQPHKSR